MTTAKCRRCGKRKPAQNSVLCLACHQETGGQDDGKKDEQVKCGCGRNALTGLDVCDICWRQQDREVPDAPIYGGLATQDPAGRFVCLGPGQRHGEETCNGSIKAVNTWTGENYYRCDRCGAVGAQPPSSFEQYMDIDYKAALKRIEERSNRLLKDKRSNRLREAQGAVKDDWSE
jgi:hypothetical protein